jgi:hypothetical protein
MQPAHESDRGLTSNFSLSLGVGGSILSENHISPVGGFVWDISDRLELRALFPHPGLSYAFNDSTKLFLGADFLGGAFRNGPKDEQRGSYVPGIASRCRHFFSTAPRHEAHPLVWIQL